MAVPQPAAPGRGVATLRRFGRRRAPAEQCDLCGAALREEHPHLVEPAKRRLVCACDPCAILFGHRGRASFRRVPTRVAALDGFAIADAQWDALAIPIGLAFFFVDSAQGRPVACYPSPAGATESRLPLLAWDEIVAAHPVVAGMEPDVEALIVNRIGRGGGPPGGRAYVVPIDACYRLVGIIRARWRGLGGGSEMWAEVDAFFAGLDARAGAAGAR